MIAASEFERAGVVVGGRRVVANRVLNAVSIGLPLAGTLLALVAWLGWGRLAPTLTTGWIFLVFFVLEVLGIGVGLHRYFTHRAFRTTSWMRALLAVLGSSAFQGPSIAGWRTTAATTASPTSRSTRTRRTGWTASPRAGGGSGS
jgi:stearoyl-CoA desaturase (delta-9 desaturase)